MTLEEIRIAYNNKEYENKLPYPNKSKYKENHVFDEEKSVKWNRVEVDVQNQLLQVEKENYRAESYRLETKLKEDIIKAICNENKGINYEQARIIYEYVYREYHSSFSDVFNYIDDFIDLIERVNNAK